MPAGCPRTVSFSKEEMIALGEEMIAWVKSHPEMLHLSEWYTIEKMFIYNQWKTFIQREEFIPYYETALKIIGRKYIDKDSKVRDSISQRWQRLYFKDLREDEDQTANEEADRKAKALKSEAKAVEEERQQVIEAVQRNRKPIQ